MSVIAVLGTGSIGSRHLRLLSRMTDVEAVAVPLRPERLADLQHQGYSVAESLESSGATGVIIATETVRHKADVVRALDMGANVLVEKPMALNEQEALHLCQYAAHAKRSIHVGCNLRFSRSLGMFREQLPRLERLHAVRIECQSHLADWRPARPYQMSYSAAAIGGGVLLDLIHEIDYCGWLFGWPRVVQARMDNLQRLGIAAEEMVDVIAESGETAISIHLDYLTRPTRRRMSAYGENGSLHWDGVQQTVVFSPDQGEEATWVLEQERDDMFLQQLAAWFEACNGGSPDRLATGEDGRRALAVCDAIRSSAAHRADESEHVL